MSSNPHFPANEVAPYPWDSTNFDFFDFGCSDGANLRFCRRFWPKLKGLGIDIDPKKVEKAKNNGHDALVFNILDLPSYKMTRFVTMCHFLEHLNSVAEAEKMIRKAIEIAEDFIFIRQPFFDADGLLLNHGLKFYWSHWRGHRNRMSVLDFYGILSAALQTGQIQGFRLYGRMPIKSTDDSCIIPLSAPIDQHHYEISQHGFKPPAINFAFPVFKEIVAVAYLKADSLLESMEENVGDLTCLYSSDQLGTTSSGSNYSLSKVKRTLSKIKVKIREKCNLRE